MVWCGELERLGSLYCVLVLQGHGLLSPVPGLSSDQRSEDDDILRVMSWYWSSCVSLEMEKFLMDL